MTRILIAAGGTGGHIIPGLAIAAELKTSAEVIFLGTGRELERKLIGSAGFELRELPAAPLLGKGIKGPVRFLKLLPSAFRNALSLYRELNPDLVIGFGGYPSVIPALAALRARVPLIIHESNVRVGLANRALSMFATRVYAVSGAGHLLNRQVTRLPNPVRKEFYGIDSLALPKQGEPWRLLVTGGSQGAMALNSAVVSLSPLFRERDIEVWHQTGTSDEERVRSGYRDAGCESSRVRVVPFIDNFAEALTWSHLVVCRAGAMTVAEITAAGRPAIFVPLPIAGGHQADNCRELVSQGLAQEVQQTNDLHDRLTAALQRYLSDAGKLVSISHRLRSQARVGGVSPAEIIAREALDLVS